MDRLKTSVSAASLSLTVLALACTSTAALDLGLGGGGVNAGAQGSIGGGGLNAGADLSIGGTGSVGVGVGVGSGTGTGTTPTAHPAVPGAASPALPGVAPVVLPYDIAQLVGTMVMSSDGKAIGYVTEAAMHDPDRIRIRVQLAQGLAGKTESVWIILSDIPRKDDTIRLGSRLDQFLRKL